MSVSHQRVRRGLLALAVAWGGAILWLSYLVFAPLLSGPGVEETSKGKARVPPYSYEAWHALPAQDGRTMPFETACMETVRQITGKTRFEGLDPVAVVLAWMLEDEASPAFTDWEHYPFILCDHRGLRQRIFDHLAQEGQPVSAALVNGKYVTPDDLRKSPAFDQLLSEAARKRRQDPAKAQFQMSTEELKAEEVGKRFVLFDVIRGHASTRLHTNALIGERYVDLRELAEIEDRTPQAALQMAEGKLRQQPDPFHLVGLDRVPGSAWFSFGELRAARNDPEKWRQYMEDRLTEAPQKYLNPQRCQALQDFQDLIRDGRGQEEVNVVEAVLRARREGVVQKFVKYQEEGLNGLANQLYYQVVVQPRGEKPDQGEAGQEEEIRRALQQKDEEVVKQLRQGVELARSKGYRPEDPEYRILHLLYLESYFPLVYRESLAAQPFPAEVAEEILGCYALLQAAYQSGEAERFDQASQAFFHTVQEISDLALIQGLAERNTKLVIGETSKRIEKFRKSGDRDKLEHEKARFFQTAREMGVEAHPYPGDTTLDLEMRFNRTQPFFWAWVIILIGAVALLASLILKSRALYMAGLGLYLTSLLIQYVGFYSRIAISGRAPVGNMYETVIWVAFMSAIFALVLELIYRRKVIALAGALVATLGLILADQLPLALDPKISPLVPVLRTNFWLTVHVLTIVSSYAGGTLAWGMGNLTLFLLVFGKGQGETLKTLANFTYRAMQIAILLLAAGTFLGGWWAAESWGRFWGWDPKEVGALIALVCYVIPLHARYLSWVGDFGLAVCAVLCYSTIILSWYVVNFVLAAGLHSYGFSGGGGLLWVVWAAAINVEWVVLASWCYMSSLYADTIP